MMGEARRRAAYVRGAVSEVGHQIMVESMQEIHRAFGPEFEAVVAIFVRRKDDPENVTYFGALEIPELANLVGEMARQQATAKMLGKDKDNG